ncbi:ExeA family protein [Pelotalea chapellei]|uniref:AAA family ATPase n=1 Tax=Pelotalea chapellei TaxID=44671 RepID=A0ABS5U7L5_9BACT|nr:ExeA family protein [Pelotalea chapellei]MBT1071633.1 AAA family ATPase [Pelotalea chapellei]
MYTKYFGFNEKPFTLTPNPRFIFLSKNHKEAFAHLLFGINNHYGFIELVGEVGTGKTTVLRTLLGQLKDESYRSALIFNPCLTGVELLRSINQEFGVDANSEYANELLASLNQFLLNENSKGRTVVLVIDEAQNLQPDVLEQIRLISNLETENDKLIQIILAGQPELEALLQRPDLRQLNQRIAVRYKLRSMSMDETRAYIRHRMEVAGNMGGVSFGYYALKWIYMYTHGVPRMINILCDRALLIAYGDERRSINARTVSRAIKEILNLPTEGRMLYARKIAFALAMIGLLIFSVAHWMPIPSSNNVAAKTDNIKALKKSVITDSNALSQPAQVRQVPKLEQELLDRDQNNTHIKAFNSLASAWGVRPIKIFKGKMTVPEMFNTLAAKRNLRCTLFKGSLDQAIGLNVPFLMVTNAKGWLGNYCVAVTSADNGSITVSPALFGSSMINKEDLAKISTGAFYLVWQNTGNIPDNISPGEKRYEIRQLQRFLKLAGVYKGNIDGDYSSLTIKAARDFQRSRNLSVDDTLGETTLAALTSYDTARRVPILKQNVVNR